MRASARSALGLGVVSLALTTSLLSTAAATTGPGRDVDSVGAKTCSTNLDIGTSSVMSQNFAPILDAYDSAAADDVRLKKTCKVSSIQVVGSYTTENAVDSETVTFYKDKDGKPGRVVSSQTKVGTDDGTGSYDIKLKPVTLKKGTYWVSVVANLDSEAGGQWYWRSSNTQKGELAQWQNPNGGWQYGCTTWAPLQECLGAGPGPDLAFSLTAK